MRWRASRRSFARATLLTSVVACLLLAAAEVSAQESSLRGPLTRLMTEGWVLGPDGAAAANKYFDEARAGAPNDLRPLYALGVTQIRQRRYVEAGAAFDELLQRKGDHLPAIQAKVWLAMVARRYDAALTELNRLVDAWPGTIVAQNSPMAEHAERQEIARFIGRVMGFLYGPAAEKVPEEQLQDFEAKLLARLDTEARTAFDESRGSALGQFTRIQDRATVQQEQAKAEENKQKEIDRGRLAAESGAVAQEKGTLEQQATAARNTAEAQLRQLGSALQLLDAQFNQLRAQALPIEVEIGTLLSQEQASLALANETDDPLERQRLLDRATFFGLQRGRAQAAYNALDLQARGVTAQRNANLAQQREVTAGYQAEMRRLGIRAENLVRAERRIASDIKKVETPATGKTAAVRSLMTTSTAFVTYYDFPVEREKRRILDSLQ